MNPPRGRTHPAPSVTAGGAFACSGGGVEPTPSYHVPVLADVVRAWAEGGRRAVDATVGGGGHAGVFRELGADVLATDRDPEAVAAARARLGEDGVHYAIGPFGSAEILAMVRAFRPDRILLDLGVSSHQLDDPVRGFTFRPGAALDMRMTPQQGVTAADVLNTWTVERLAGAFTELADEPWGKKLARVIVKRRARTPFATSDDLVGAIRETLGPRSGPPEFARLFQALRIAVNEEREQLELALPALRAALRPGGRIAVITYHSGEDRIVKNALREWAKSCVCPPKQPVCTCRGRALGRVLTKKPVRPAEPEILANPRARSARLRAFEVTL
ncbi:MAG: 16S rRNA (cytosine(1402)-N(4))-methyltransferase [Gemmatimonadetes bacterium]|nr:MAG: 16S rRNA (cytosine(1402)-N(4))-methyltransferase [Gemmatimonadota bacterium]